MAQELLVVLGLREVGHPLVAGEGEHVASANFVGHWPLGHDVGGSVEGAGDDQVGFVLCHTVVGVSARPDLDRIALIGPQLHDFGERGQVERGPLRVLQLTVDDAVDSALVRVGADQDHPRRIDVLEGQGVLEEPDLLDGVVEGRIELLLGSRRSGRIGGLLLVGLPCGGPEDTNGEVVPLGDEGPREGVEHLLEFVDVEVEEFILEGPGIAEGIELDPGRAFATGGVLDHGDRFAASLDFLESSHIGLELVEEDGLARVGIGGLLREHSGEIGEVGPAPRDVEAKEVDVVVVVGGELRGVGLESALDDCLQSAPLGGDGRHEFVELRRLVEGLRTCLDDHRTVVLEVHDFAEGGCFLVRLVEEETRIEPHSAGELPLDYLIGVEGNCLFHSWSP